MIRMAGRTGARGPRALLVLGAWALAILMLAALSVLPAAAAAKTTITIYFGAGNATKLDWQKRMIEKFQQQNPDIKVELITDAGSTYHEKLLTLWATNNPPDVWDEGGAVRTYVNNGWLLDLAPFVARDRAELNIEDFMPAAWRAYQDGKHIWGIPFMSTGSFVFYNVGLVEKAGLPNPPINWDDKSWTWDRMVEYAKKMTIQDAQGGLKQAGVSAVHWSIMDVAYPWMFGGDWFDEEAYRTGRPARSLINTPENVRAYQSAVDLVWKLKIAPNPEGAVSPSQFFYNGQAGLMLGAGPWGLLGRDEKRKFDWGMAPVPRGGGVQVDPATIVYTDPWMISSQTKNPEAAWKFVKFMTSKETMLSFTDMIFLPPARKSALVGYIVKLAQLSGQMTSQQVLLAMEGAQRYGRESVDHLIDGWPDFNQAMLPLFAEMWGNRKSVPQTLADIEEAWNLIIRKQQGKR
ncbi:MAG: ABC transporter substrate-binding protein [Bacteroidota bacterium]